MATNYSPAQIADIRKRESDALEYLKSVNLTPACQIVKENIGNDIFADRLHPYLADTLYSAKLSEIQVKDL